MVVNSTIDQVTQGHLQKHTTWRISQEEDYFNCFD